MFRHPKYYKELRKRNKSDQAISEATGTPTRQSVRPGPGLKLRHGGLTPEASGNKQQASSAKQQASSESKPEPSSGSQASSDKL